jgi:uncharacterized protein YegJ (DUF2314 family)
MRKYGFPIILVLAIFVSYFNFRGNRISRSGEPDLITVSNDDAGMKTAIRKARETIGVFIKYRSDPIFSKAFFSIKVRYEENGKTEHIWLDDVTFDGKLFHGVIGNVPVEIKRLSLGERVDASIDTVSDWMIYDGNSLIGGYTVRVLKNRMSPKERQLLDKVEFKDK